MDNPRRRIVTDEVFVLWVSRVLLLVGGVGLIMGVSCHWVSRPFCEDKILDLFGGMKGFDGGIAAINLPFTVVLLSFAVRQFSFWGWFLSMALLALLTFFFWGIAHILWENQEVWRRSAQPDAMADFIESLMIDMSLGVLALGGLIFLSLPMVRKLYIQHNKAV